MGLMSFGIPVVSAAEIVYDTTTFEGEVITIPINVAYVETTPEIFERAQVQVRKILTNKENFGENFGYGNERIDKLLIGGFVRKRICSLEKDKEFDYENFRTDITFSLLPPHPHYGWWIADETKIIEFFKYFNETYNFTDECVIRKPRTDELAIIWRLIGWDITEPMLVVEENDLRLVIDFDADFKNIEWLEDISDVKFLLSVGEKLVEIKPAIVGDPKNGNILYMGNAGEEFLVIE